MRGLTRTLCPMADRRPARGILDISVVIDLEHILLAATACAAGLPLYTRNPDDFRTIGDLVEVIAV